MTDEKPQSKRRQRSRSYPYLSLQESVNLAQIFYKKEGRHAVPASVAIEDLGYSPTSGSGRRVLAALLHFGLLLEEGGSGDDRNVGLSELGKTIVMDTRSESPDRENAIREAALNPNIHRELWERWQLNDKSLPSDQTMKFALLREYDFNDAYVSRFIKNFKETLAFARLGREFTISDEPVEESEDAVQDNSPSPSQQRSNPQDSTFQINPQARQLTFPLIGGDVLTLIVPRPLTKKDFQNLKMWIELMEDPLLYRDINHEDDMDT